MNTSPWINYHHLLYFKTIAEEQSVSKAAAKLRLGQPTLSAQLKQFEESLGIKLFERQHKKLLLTEQGRIALDYARQIFKMGDEMYEVLHDRLVPTRPHLQIGALDSIPKQVILQLSKAAYRIGKCQISLVEGKFEEMIRELVSHRIDLFVSNFLPSAKDAKGLSHKTIIKGQVGVYGSPKYKHIRKNFPQSLQNQHFVVPTYDSRLRSDLDHWFKTQNISVDIIAETQDISLKKLMAIDGLGLIPAATHTVNRQILSGELIEIGKIEGVSEELYFISAQRKIDNPIAALLVKNFSV